MLQLRMKELVNYHHAAVNGGSVVVGLCETLHELAEYLDKYNEGVEAEYEATMVGVEAIRLDDLESTGRAKIKYGSNAETKRKHDTLHNGGELVVGQEYRRINPVFPSDEHALVIVHGLAGEQNGPILRTADGMLSDGLHEI